MVLNSDVEQEDFPRPARGWGSTVGVKERAKVCFLFFFNPFLFFFSFYSSSLPFFFERNGSESRGKKDRKTE